MAYRLDIGSLGNAKRTPQGGIKVPAFLTRTGVFEYHVDNKVIREYRPSEEVFKADTLTSLRDATVTNQHPPENVASENYKKYTVGHVSGEAKQDGDKVSADLIVQDSAAIKAINKGRREISCGYHCDVDEVPGVTADGQAYDRVQRNITYNHVAIVDNGRAGSSVRLRLDSAGNSISKSEDDMSVETVKKFERIDGVEYELETEAHTAAVTRQDVAGKATKEAHAALVARCDAAEANLAQAQKDLAEANSPVRIDQAVKERVAVLDAAKPVLGKDFKSDELTNEAVKLAAVTKAFPTLKLDSLNERIKEEGERNAYVNGLFASLSASTRADSAPKLGVPVPAHLQSPPPGFNGEGKFTLDESRRNRNDELESRHLQPLMVSKDNPSKAIDGFPAIQSSMLETMK